MRKKVEHTPFSEEIPIPFEVFQEYFQEADKRRTQTRWAFAISLVLGLAVLALMIALPFLAPILVVSVLVSAAGLLEAYLIAILPTLILAFTPSFIFGGMLFLKLDFHLEKNSIQVLSGKYHFIKKVPTRRGIVDHTVKLHISPPGITLSKTKKDNTEYTLVSPNQCASVSENILGSSLIEANTSSILEIIMDNLEQKKRQLEDIQGSISIQMNNPHNSTQKTSMLSSKLATIRQQITRYDQTLNTLKSVFDEINFKNKVERTYRSPLQELFVFLENHKENVTHINRKNMEINQKIEQLKKEKKKHPHPEILSEKIQMLEDLKRNNLKVDKLVCILNSIPMVEVELHKMKQGRSQPEIDYIEYAIAKMKSDKQILSNTISEMDPLLYIEYFTEGATRHYSRLLQEKDSNHKTMELLNNILIDHPDSYNSVNQTVNYILANHFYRQFKNNRTEAIAEKACLAALKLDSSDERNTDLKEMVILHAFYKDPQNTDLPIEIKNLLLTSNSKSETYNAIKEILETKPPTQALQFSSPGQNFPATSSSSEPTPSSNLPKSFR